MGASLTLTEDYRLWPTLTAFAFAAPACAWAATVVPPLAFAAFGLSLVWLGLPHGAVDDSVAVRLGGRAPSWPRRLPVIALYLGLAGAVYGFWWVAPRTACVAFLGLTLLHWGQGDAHFVARACPGYFHGTAHRLAFALWRGAAPICLPLAFHPEQYSRVLAGAVGLFEPHATLGTLDPTGRTALAASALGLWALEKGMAGDRLTRCRGVLAEDAVLLVAFLVLPPLVSVGVYFVLWHSPRHLVRLGAVSGPSPWAFRWPQFVPWTVASLLALAAFAWWRGVHAPDWTASLGAYLVLLSGLTLPHSLVVLWMDVEETATMV